MVVIVLLSVIVLIKCARIPSRGLCLKVRPTKLILDLTSQLSPCMEHPIVGFEIESLDVPIRCILNPTA